VEVEGTSSRPSWREQTVVSVEVASHVLGISRGLAYASAREYLATGGVSGLPVVLLGRRMLVPVTRLERLLEGSS